MFRHSVLSDSLQFYGLWPAGILYPWNFPGKNTGVGCHFLLQGLFLTQGSNQHLPHWQADTLPPSLEGSTEVPGLYLKRQNLITAGLRPE